MARFYNKTRGFITISKRDGTPVPVGPKRWVDVDPVDESAVSLLAAVRRGDLVRESLPAEVPAAPAPEAPELSQPPAPPVPAAAAPVAAPVKAEDNTRQPGESKKSASKALDVEKPGLTTTNPTSSADAAEKHPSDKRRPGRE